MSNGDGKERQANKQQTEWLNGKKHNRDVIREEGNLKNNKLPTTGQLLCSAARVPGCSELRRSAGKHTH